MLRGLPSGELLYRSYSLPLCCPTQGDHLCYLCSVSESWHLSEPIAIPFVYIVNLALMNDALLIHIDTFCSSFGKKCTEKYLTLKELLPVHIVV
jgi:hypothetical protein